ncbi:lytic transglycosylase domain-containing protein [Anaerosolibacter sp.]|uniref:lytic transglycosylase domain-containing protein n=1 Tax=Anaerosolibacter sp. TaxID=1872527 RepID=UPI0039F02438
MTKWKPYIVFAVLLAVMDIVFAFWMMGNFGEDIRLYLKKQQGTVVTEVKETTQEKREPLKVMNREEKKRNERKTIDTQPVINEKREETVFSFKEAFKGIREKLKSIFQTKEKRALADAQKQRDFLAFEIKKRTQLSDNTIAQILQYEQRTGMPIKIVLAVMDQESSFNKDAVGTSEDRGLMQIIPETEAWLCKKYGEQFGISYDPKRIFDEDYNIALGTIYLWHLYKAYPENYHRIFTEYNRGYYKAANYYKEKGHYMTTYSKKVMEKMKKYEELESLEGDLNL